jgi:hypothetical protein
VKLGEPAWERDGLVVDSVCNYVKKRVSVSMAGVRVLEPAWKRDGCVSSGLK